MAPQSKGTHDDDVWAFDAAKARRLLVVPEEKGEVQEETMEDGPRPWTLENRPGFHQTHDEVDAIGEVARGQNLHDSYKENAFFF